MIGKIDKVIVASNVYDITYENDLENYGVAYFNSQQINISPRIGHEDLDNPCEASMVRTLLHEVLHIIFKVRFEYFSPIAKLKPQQEEHLIDELANNLYEFLISNPAVLEICKEHSSNLTNVIMELNEKQ